MTERMEQALEGMMAYKEEIQKQRQYHLDKILQCQREEEKADQEIELLCRELGISPPFDN